MGCILSSRKAILDSNDIDGDEHAYHDRFLETTLLGAGEFAKVLMVQEMHPQEASQQSAEPLACKILNKGITFKDNVLYSPLKPEALRTEVRILQTISGKHQCVRLHSVYESPSHLYIVTELCHGGSMIEYIANHCTSLTVGDVSRMSFELLDAVNYCHSHGIIHRDIKPENVMFKHAMEGSPVRLIDFGSSSMEACRKQNTSTNGGKAQPKVGEKEEEDTNDANLRHHTFAGSAFYISPEMFKKDYTSLTDVWSVGVTLYVLVAGYPADDLQSAFNIIQQDKEEANGESRLRKLPNLVDAGMPDSFIEMLDKLLNYQYNHREGPEEILKTDSFLQLHTADQQQEGDLDLSQIAADAAAGGANENESVTNNSSAGKWRNDSVVMGTVRRHNLYQGYKKFERCVTTLLATMLLPAELDGLIDALSYYVRKREQQSDKDGQGMEMPLPGTISNNDVTDGGNSALKHNSKHLQQHLPSLKIVKFYELKEILLTLRHEIAARQIAEIPRAAEYSSFAYHISLLKQFSNRALDGNSISGSQKSFMNLSNSGKNGQMNRSRNNLNNSGHRLHDSSILDNSISKKLKRVANNSRRMVVSVTAREGGSHGPKENSSVHGNNVYMQWKKAKMNNSNQSGGKLFGGKDTLSSSAHVPTSSSKFIKPPSKINVQAMET